MSRETIFLILSVHFYTCRVVRLNSPNLNYLIIIGSYIMNVAIFFRLMPSTDIIVNAARCNVSSLIGDMILIVFVLFMKNWFVHANYDE